MIEIYTLIMTLLIAGLGWLLGPDLAAALYNWLPFGAAGGMLLLSLLLYLSGLPLLALICQFTGTQQGGRAASGDEQPQIFGGLQHFNQPIHGAVALILLVAAVRIALMLPDTPPTSIGLIMLGGTIAFATWIHQYRGIGLGPLPPETLDCVSRRGAIQLSWSLPEDARRVGVRLFRMPASSSLFDPHSIETPLYQGMLTSFTDRDVLPGVASIYWLFTIDVYDRFAAVVSEPVATLPPPSPPIDLTYTARRDSISLRWRLVDQAGTRQIRIIRYRLPAKQPDGEHLVEACECWYDGNLPSGAAFAYTIGAIDRDGQEARAELACAATLVAPPQLSARVIRRNQVELTWTVPADIPDFQSVTIWRAKADAGEQPTLIYRGTSRSHIDPEEAQGLEFATAYIYTIEAHYTEPIRSEQVSARVETASAPAALQRLDVDATRRELTLRWQPPASEPIKQIRIAREWFDFEQNQIRREEIFRPSNETSYTFASVESGQLYHFEVAYQSMDDHWSAPVQLERATEPPPPQPLDVRASWASPGGPLTLTWRQPADPTIAGTQIVRRQDHTPEAPTEGQIVARDARSPWTDNDATSGQHYYYGLFSYDSDRVFSAPAPAEVQTHTKLPLVIEFPDLGYTKRRKLATHVPIHKLVAALLQRQGIDLATVTDWSATIAETGQRLADTTNLLEAKVQPGQTLQIHWSTQPAATAPADDQSQPPADAGAGPAANIADRAPAPASEAPSEAPPDSSPAPASPEKVRVKLRIGAEQQPTTVQLRTDRPAHQLVSTLLSRHQVDLAQVAAWQLFVEELQRPLHDEERLADAGVRDHFTLTLNYTLQSAAPVPEDPPERQAEQSGDGEPLGH
jgi:uncharacterized ubiquitin-like protein YukD